MKKYLPVLLVSSFLCLSACQSAYYGAMEKVGYHKRDIMLDRVQDAKESQQDAQKQFSSALEELQSLLQIDGNNLEASYNKAKDEYESAQTAADEVSNRIERVEDVADALFEEWQDEIDEISKASLRNNSLNKLKETQRLYARLIKSMRRAEAKMPPILTSMKDNMLYLKHNLNAQAIGAIRGEFDSLQTDISVLLKAMNKSIEDSNRFIASMSKG
jgi:chromosome segregation ATPase